MLNPALHNVGRFTISIKRFTTSLLFGMSDFQNEKNK
uniref:Uncharacterized protein n=1 Tax=Anguilla anguilla TaxID=7936 RepID=A0A0E9PXQ0_ANGAN